MGTHILCLGVAKGPSQLHTGQIYSGQAKEHNLPLPGLCARAKVLKKQEFLEKLLMSFIDVEDVVKWMDKWSGTLDKEGNPIMKTEFIR